VNRPDAPRAGLARQPHHGVAPFAHAAVLRGDGRLAVLVLELDVGGVVVVVGATVVVVAGAGKRR